MKRAALTFDDGPSEWTPAILDLLAEHDARATFFVLGCCVYVPTDDLVARMIDDGHELGVHGWNHSPVEDLSAQEIFESLAATAERISANGDTVLRWWRPPWHRVTADATAAVERLGLSYCGVTLDGHDVSREFDAIVSTIERGLTDGSVVGLHDGVAANGQQVYKHREHTVAAVGWILTTLSGEWEFVTVSELLG